MILQSR